MKKLKIEWTIKKFMSEMKKGNLDFNYPIQRKGGQWDLLQKSLLIHTLAEDFPLPTFYTISEVVEEEVNGKMKKKTVYRVLDGKQRYTSIHDFIRGEYALHEETPDVYLDGEKFEVAGKWHGELDKEVVEAIEDFSVLMYKLEDVTDEQIEEVFYRLQNGTPLSKQQKAKSKMGTAWATKIKTLVEHPLVKDKANFTELQLRKADDETAILQTMMLLDDKHELKSIASNEVFDYAQTFRGNAEKVELVTKIKNAMDYLDKAFTGKESILLKKVHFPMTLLTAIKALEMGVHETRFGDWKDEFKKALKLKSEITTNYKDFGGAGSVKKAKTLARIEAMQKHLEEYLGQSNKNVVWENKEDAKPVVEEKKTEAPVTVTEPVQESEKKTDTKAKPEAPVAPKATDKPSKLNDIKEEEEKKKKAGQSA